jgi:RNA polymerase sigma-70 factor, ECF subfamily
VGESPEEPSFDLSLKRVARDTFAPPIRQTPLANVDHMKNLNDDEVMNHLQAGHGDALAVLFDRYHRLVLSIALKIVRDPGEAEDVMQNVFLEIFRSAAQFDPARGTTKTWLLQYAYHRSINRRQQLTVRHFYKQSSIEDVERTMPEAGSLLGGFSDHELKLLLRQGLAKLGRQQRQVLELASYNGLSMAEIASKTGETVSNVRHYYYRGLKKLRSLLSGEQELDKRHE